MTSGQALKRLRGCHAQGQAQAVTAVGPQQPAAANELIEADGQLVIARRQISWQLQRMQVRDDVARLPEAGGEVATGRWPITRQGQVARFAWTANGSVVNFDLHGDGSGQNISYERGRAVPGADGILTAAFTGNHGWFWRNRDRQDVTVTLYVRGDYSEMVRP